MIRETLDPSPGEDYVRQYRYDTQAPAAIAALHVDTVDPARPSAWLTSNDGQTIVVPFELRKLAAKRLREALP